MTDRQSGVRIVRLLVLLVCYCCATVVLLLSYCERPRLLYRLLTLCPAAY